MDRSINYSWKGTDTRKATFTCDLGEVVITWNVHTHGMFVNGVIFNVGDFKNERATYPEFYAFVEEVYNNPKEYLAA